MGIDSGEASGAVVRRLDPKDRRVARTVARGRQAGQVFLLLAGV